MSMDILANKNKLLVVFTPLIPPDISGNIVYLWNFGDGTTSGESNPSHTYPGSGFYNVKLTITYNQNTSDSSALSLAVSDKVNSTLSGSIYQLFNNFIPIPIQPSITTAIKRFYIEKWQLYLLPLLNHVLSAQDYNDELAFEALENQLIVELAAYDYLKVLMQQLMVSIQASSQNSGGSGENGDVKKIVTGPSEVEFYGTLTESQVSSYKILQSAFQKDGSIDTLKKDLCMLATRLDIYLPICKNDTVEKPVIEVANRRDPGLLGGPNPPYLVENSIP